MSGPSQRDSDPERWFSVVLRSLHLAGVVWLGSSVLGGAALGRAPAAWVFGSGLAMLVMDLRAGRIALRELAGAFVLVKLVLAGWMAFDATQARWIFWLLVVASSVVSHAPKSFRHWTAMAQRRASKSSNPG